MLPRAHRLRERRAVVMTLRRGVTASSRFLAVHARATRQPGPRFAIVVSKKVARRAVDRNRIRRRIKAILMHHHRLPPSTHAVVIRVRPPALALTTQNLTQDLARLLRTTLR